MQESGAIDVSRNRLGTAAFVCMAEKLHARLRVKATRGAPVRRARRLIVLMALPFALMLFLAPAGSAPGPPNSSTTQVFAAGFEIPRIVKDIVFRQQCLVGESQQDLVTDDGG